MAINLRDNSYHLYNSLTEVSGKISGLEAVYCEQTDTDSQAWIGVEWDSLGAALSVLFRCLLIDPAVGCTRFSLH